MPVATINHATKGPVKLGRKRPVSIRNIGRFKVITLDSGRNVILPRLSMNYNRSKDKSPPPDMVDYSAKAAASLSRMYLNDQLGDCVIASKAHMIGVASGNDADASLVATDQEIDKNYVSICGPGDNGCNITDVLDAMKAGQFIMSGAPATIDAYVAVAADQNLLKVAIDLFGGVTLGVNLTSDCTDSGAGVVWNFAGRIVGGHDIFAYGYNSQGVLISTWGTTGTVIPWSVMTKDAGNDAGVEERYASLTKFWYDAGNLSPNGIDVKTLQADLAAIASGNVPDVPPVTPPTPVPPVPPSPPSPPPAPPLSWWQKIIAWLESLLAAHKTVGQVKRDKTFDAAVEFGLTPDATLDKIDWSAIIAWIKAELALYGPAIVPVLQAWINSLSVGPIIKGVLMMLLSLLVGQLPPAPPTTGA